jgi:hypothetical protein
MRFTGEHVPVVALVAASEARARWFLLRNVDQDQPELGSVLVCTAPLPVAMRRAS